jgi:hypothetical protein
LSTEEKLDGFAPLPFVSAPTSRQVETAEAGISSTMRWRATYAPPALRRHDIKRVEGAATRADQHPTVLPLTEGELARACAAAASSGRRAGLASVSAERDRAVARALTALESLRGEAAQAFERELDRIALHAAALVAAAAGDCEQQSEVGLRYALQRLCADTLEEVISSPELVIHAAKDTAAALETLPANPSVDPGRPSSVSVAIDPLLPEDAVRLTWTSGWAEVRAGYAARLLRDRLAEMTLPPPMETSDDLAA